MIGAANQAARNPGTRGGNMSQNPVTAALAQSGGALQAPAGRSRRGTVIKLGLLGVLLVIAAIFPLVITNALYTQFAVNTMIYVGAVAAWNLFSGYSGYLSLGTAVFFGSGAYTVGLLTQHGSCRARTSSCCCRWAGWSPR